MADKYPVVVGPPDIYAAIDTQLEVCSGIRIIPSENGHSDYKKKYIKACMLGAVDFGRVSHSKFKGFISSPDDNNAVGLQVRRRCSERFGKHGSMLTDACILGADGVLVTVDLIGRGMLRRKDKLSGKKNR
jgi:hypothetical protein